MLFELVIIIFNKFYMHIKFRVKDGKFLCKLCYKSAKARCYFCKQIIGYGKFYVDCKCGIDSHADEIHQR